MADNQHVIDFSILLNHFPDIFLADKREISLDKPLFEKKESKSYARNKYNPNYHSMAPQTRFPKTEEEPEEEREGEGNNIGYRETYQTEIQRTHKPIDITNVDLGDLLVDDHPEEIIEDLTNIVEEGQLEVILPTSQPKIEEKIEEPEPVVKKMEWQYIDIENTIEGPFLQSQMHLWWTKGLLPSNLRIKMVGRDQDFVELETRWRNVLESEIFLSDPGFMD